MSLCKASVPLGRAIFDPSAKILTILIEDHLMKLHTKYQRPGPSSFRVEFFLSFHCMSL